MKTKTRILLPILLTLVILGACIGGWLWYDSNIDRSGWVEEDGIRYYQDFYADPVSGWLDLPDGRYYFHEDGTPHTGWQTIDGITYFFEDSGTMHTGWLVENGQTYYFGGNGTMVVGWLWLEDGRYFLRDGALLTGWQEIGGSTYYFSQEGMAALGLTQIGEDWYYFNDGILATGEQIIDGETYLFQEDGKRYTGWQELEDGSRRYFLPEGPMARSWVEADGTYRYFDENGVLVTGWLQLGEYRYYLTSEGTITTGPATIDGQTHYFTPHGIEVVLVNAMNPVPKWYDQTLVNVVENHDVDARCYDALLEMLAGLTEAGIEYTFNSAYRTILEQTTIMEYRTREHMKNYNLEFKEARDKAMETVAIPGTSEHHLGLAVDLLGGEAVAWLTEHCWDYGFIVRYTEEKEHITGIVDEPWHFRYVGKAVSQDMKNSGLCLEEYLGAKAIDMEEVKDYYGDELYQETVYVPPETQPPTTQATEPQATEASEPQPEPSEAG